ncbi:MAG TPA: ATP-binding cassette domain-containing protein [Flavobacteriales bacterium]|nr:ATP-binding cassette domain-containing protein [Flavobacteriales bacterium]HMR28802.1 ATP-binding cassette domain-containing protein [Flavobacteriales bacterium]
MGTALHRPAITAQLLNRVQLFLGVEADTKQRSAYDHTHVDAAADTNTQQARNTADLRTAMNEAAASDPFINVRDVHFAYGDGPAVLNGLSFNFTLKKGQTLAVVGGSGSGKSTLLRLIAGLLPGQPQDRSSGRITVGGMSPVDYRRAGGLSFIFQDPTLLDHMTVAENIALPLLTKRAKADHANDLRTVMEVVGMHAHAQRLPRELSGGMRTRVSLARAFVNAPDALLLDEPFSALDIAWKSRLYGYFMDLRTRYNTTSVLVTHDIQEAAILGDHVLVIGNNGQVVFDKAIRGIHQGHARIAHLNDHLKEMFDPVIGPIQEELMNAPLVGNGTQPRPFS